jgi:hypothetical protein
MFLWRNFLYFSSCLIAPARYVIFKCCLGSERRSPCRVSDCDGATTRFTLHAIGCTEEK